eukprot:scaffold5584_cov76-Cyclotella_meneghiniana.AAC.2
MMWRTLLLGVRGSKWAPICAYCVDISRQEEYLQEPYPSLTAKVTGGVQVGGTARLRLRGCRERPATT